MRVGFIFTWFVSFIELGTGIITILGGGYTFWSYSRGVAFAVHNPEGGLGTGISRVELFLFPVSRGW